MKILHWLVGLVLFVLILAGGVSLVQSAVTGDNNGFLAYLFFYGRTWYGRFLVGAAMILGVAFYLLTAFSHGRIEEFLTFENEGGSIGISVKAVTDYLAQLAGDFAGLESLQAGIVSRTGAIAVSLDVVVKAGSNIPELCKQLQQRVRESLRDNMGIPEVGTVKVNVVEIVTAARAKDREEGGRRETWQDTTVL